MATRSLLRSTRSFPAAADVPYWTSVEQLRRYKNSCVFGNDEPQTNIGNVVTVMNLILHVLVREPPFLSLSHMASLLLLRTTAVTQKSSVGMVARVDKGHGKYDWHPGTNNRAWLNPSKRIQTEVLQVLRYCVCWQARHTYHSSTYLTICR